MWKGWLCSPGELLSNRFYQNVQATSAYANVAVVAVAGLAESGGQVARAVVLCRTVGDDGGGGRALKNRMAPGIKEDVLSQRRSV